MNKHCTRLLAILVGVMAYSGVSLAASVDITGQAYGDQIGLIHFDPNTAKNPNPAIGEFKQAKYYVGPTKQFRVSPYESWFGTGTNPLYSPYNETVRVRISTDDADCDIAPNTVSDGCLIKGFAWSDKVGWIVMDGKIIQQGIIDAGGNASDYPIEYFPRVKASSTDPDRVGITGIAWNESTGWINLSWDNSGKTGILTDSDAQTKDNWGAYLEIGATIDTVTVSVGPPAVYEKLGRHISGFAWSERLGWIKMSKTPTDSLDFQTHTLWTPDNTPPIPLASDKVWLVPGVNSGYGDPDISRVPATMVWENFAIDPESGINHKKTKFYLREVNTIGLCNPPAEASIGRLTRDLPAKYSSLGVGDALMPVFPGLGFVKNVPSFYCKYELHAEIWNDVNQKIFLGDHFDTTGAPANTKFSPLTVYVRAGDPSDYVSKATVDPNPPTNLIADGEEKATYQIDLLDVAGNPIGPIDCTAEYANCPGRTVSMSATVVNDVKYDLTQLSQKQEVRPVKHADLLSSSAATFFSELDANYLGGNQWEVDLDQPSSNQYQIELASYAPTGTFFRPEYSSNMTSPVVLQIDKFNYTLHNEELRPLNRAIASLSPFIPSGALWFTLKDETDGFVDECYEDTDAGTNPPCLIPFFRTTVPANRVQIGGQIQSTVPRSITFKPGITVENATISGEVGSLLTTSFPTDISFTLKNDSQTKEISGASGSDNGLIAIDNIFQYYGGASAAVVEAQRMSNESAGEQDPYLGWSDPFEYCIDCSRFELYMNEGHHSDSSALAGLYTPLNSLFADYFVRSGEHPVDKFWFNLNASDSSKDLTYSEMIAGAVTAGFDIDSLPSDLNQIDAEGQYFQAGLTHIPKIHEPTVPLASGGDLSDPYNYEPSFIDRADSANLDLSNDSAIDKTIRFFTEKLVSSTLGSFEFRLTQQIAYRYPDQTLPTIYSQIAPNLDDVQVRDLGLEATGTIAGEQIVTGRQFDVVGNAGTRKLQEQVRRNVAEMLAGVDTENCRLTSDFQEIDAFNVTGSDCVIEDPVSHTIFAYYEGSKGQTLVLGDGTQDLVVPNAPYTVILRGGANLFIRNNILYNPSNTNSSFGMIVIAENIGKDEANVLLSPQPTNISGILYAEGSLLSVADDFPGGDDLEPYVFYGGGGADIKALSNQLYWKGSIASRNTIAGAGIKKLPAGVEEDCLPEDTDFSCAQRYDLDYLRRFTPVTDATQSIIANDGLFSGGGSCTAGSCIQGSAPSLITLNLVGSNHIIDEDLSELAPVFVEKDNTIINIPPPGFTVSVGLESKQEIR